MNVTLVATLLRELADALEEPEEERASGAKARPVRRRDRGFPPPPGPVSETDRTRARKMLRRRGIHT